MRIALILILTITNSFALDDKHKLQCIENAEKISTLKAKSKNKVKTKYKLLKSRKRFDNFIDPNSKIAKRLEAIKLKITSALNDRIVSIGPYRIEEMDSDNPRYAYFKVSPKRGRRVTLNSIEFDYLKKGVLKKLIKKRELDFKGEAQANIIKLDLNEFELGEHKILVRLKYKFNLGRWQKMLSQYFASDVERLPLDTAHIALDEVWVHPIGNSGVDFDLAGSYSDNGEITQINIKVFRENQLESEDIIDPRVSGTFVSVAFKEAGQYFVEATVTDSFGDTDTTRSRTYEVSAVAPQIAFSVTQDDSYKDVFYFDPAGTSSDIEGMIIYANTPEGELLQEWWFPGHEVETGPKQLKIPSRGDIRFAFGVYRSDGTDNYIENSTIFNIPEDTIESRVLFLSHTFFDNQNPKGFIMAFVNPIEEANFKQFKAKITDSNGVITELTQDYPDALEDFFHFYIKLPASGEFDLELTVEGLDDTSSIPFPYKVNVEEFDLGAATLAMTIQPSFEGSTTDYFWSVDLENSSAGNFGYFERYYCDLGNGSTIESTDMYHYFSLERGQYQIECFGVANTGLVSSNELKFNIDARNVAPVVNSVEFAIIDPTFKEYEFYVDFNDQDGWVELVEIDVTTPSGNVDQFAAWDIFNYQLNEDGEYTFIAKVIDNEGLESENYITKISEFNEPPVFKFARSEKLDNSPRAYNLYTDLSDDGYVEYFFMKIIDPDGGESQYDYTSELYFDFNQPGDWKIELYAQDNLGKTTTETTVFTIENEAPLISNVSVSLVEGASRDFMLIFISSDKDGFVTDGELIVKGQSGSEFQYTGVFSPFYLTLSEPDLYSYKFRAQDNDGTWSDYFEGQVFVENKAPIISSFTIEKQEGSNRTYQIFFDASDEDGFVTDNSLMLTFPSGFQDEYRGLDSPIRDFYLPSAGTYEISFTVQDNEGKVSDPVHRQIEIQNSAPTVNSIEISAIDDNARLFRISPKAQDLDGWLIASELEIAFPDGNTHFSGVAPDDIELINLSAPGIYNITYRVQDNDGLWSDIYSTEYEIINKIPVPVFSISQVSADRWYFFMQDSYDLDGYIEEVSVEFTGPDGAYEVFNTFGNFEVQLYSVGEWQVLYGVKDNDGAWSVSEEGTLSVNIENIAPEVTLSYEQTGPREYTFYPSYNDVDGYFVDTGIIIRDPNGLEVNYSPENNIHVFSITGLYEIVAYGVDHDGAIAEKTVTVDIQPFLPVVELSYIEESTGKINLIAEATDPDGSIVESGLIVTHENNEPITFPISNNYFSFVEGGNYNIELYAVDNEGNRSSANIVYSLPYNYFNGFIGLKDSYAVGEWVELLADISGSGFENSEWYISGLEQRITGNSFTYAFDSEGVYHLNFSYRNSVGESLSFDLSIIVEANLNDIEILGDDLIKYPLKSQITKSYGLSRTIKNAILTATDSYGEQIEIDRGNLFLNYKGMPSSSIPKSIMIKYVDSEGELLAEKTIEIDVLEPSLIGEINLVGSGYEYVISSPGSAYNGYKVLLDNIPTENTPLLINEYFLNDYQSIVKISGDTDNRIRYRLIPPAGKRLASNFKRFETSASLYSDKAYVRAENVYFSFDSEIHSASCLEETNTNFSVDLDIFHTINTLFNDIEVINFTKKSSVVLKGKNNQNFTARVFAEDSLNYEKSVATVLRNFDKFQDSTKTLLDGVTFVFVSQDTYKKIGTEKAEGSVSPDFKNTIFIKAQALDPKYLEHLILHEFKHIWHIEVANCMLYRDQGGSSKFKNNYMTIKRFFESDAEHFAFSRLPSLGNLETRQLAFSVNSFEFENYSSLIELKYLNSRLDTKKDESYKNFFKFKNVSKGSEYLFPELFDWFGIGEIIDQGFNGKEYHLKDFELLIDSHSREKYIENTSNLLLELSLPKILKVEKGSLPYLNGLRFKYVVTSPTSELSSNSRNMLKFDLNTSSYSFSRLLGGYEREFKILSFEDENINSSNYEEFDFEIGAAISDDITEVFYRVYEIDLVDSSKELKLSGILDKANSLISQGLREVTGHGFDEDKILVVIYGSLNEGNVSTVLNIGNTPKCSSKNSISAVDIDGFEKIFPRFTYNGTQINNYRFSRFHRSEFLDEFGEYDNRAYNTAFYDSFYKSRLANSVEWGVLDDAQTEVLTDSRLKEFTILHGRDIATGREEILSEGELDFEKAFDFYRQYFIDDYSFKNARVFITFDARSPVVQSILAERNIDIPKGCIVYWDQNVTGKNSYFVFGSVEYQDVEISNGISQNGIGYAYEKTTVLATGESGSLLKYIEFNGKDVTNVPRVNGKLVFSSVENSNIVRRKELVNSVYKDTTNRHEFFPVIVDEGSVRHIERYSPIGYSGIQYTPSLVWEKSLVHQESDIRGLSAVGTSTVDCGEWPEQGIGLTFVETIGSPAFGGAYYHFPESEGFLPMNGRCPSVDGLPLEFEAIVE